MKPGSLVVCEYYPKPKMCGVIIRESITLGPIWNGKAYRWCDKEYNLWEVWCDNEIIVDDEAHLKLVEMI